jgi:phosphoadenosine phosphosulfate reductase
MGSLDERRGPVLDAIDIEWLNEELGSAHPLKTLQWAFENVSPVAIAASSQLGGLVLVHMARQLVDRVPVLFIQTGFHFPETIEFMDRIVNEWGLELIQTKPTLGPERQAKEIHPELYKVDPDMCCELNKVMPLQEILNSLDGWVTGIRRDQTAERSATGLSGAATPRPDGIVVSFERMASLLEIDTEHHEAVVQPGVHL